MDDPPLDPRAEIPLLEARIEQLEGKIESCQKFILAARVAMALGAVLFVALLLGAIMFDMLPFCAAVVAVIGGFVVSGSNRSTAQEAEAELGQARADRAAMIGLINLRVVAQNPTLH